MDKNHPQPKPQIRGAHQMAPGAPVTRVRDTGMRPEMLAHHIHPRMIARTPSQRFTHMMGRICGHNPMKKS